MTQKQYFVTEPAEQTAEEFLDSLTYDLQTLIDNNPIDDVFVHKSDAIKYADLRIKETLEAAAKELPSDGDCADNDEYPAYREASNDEREGFYNGARWMRQQAEPIIASLKQDVSHNANRAIEIAAELDEAIAKIKELEATNAQLREKEIRGDRKIAQLEHEVVVLRSRIREMEAEAEWVSVNDRLPEKNGSYLIVDPNSPLIEKREVVHYDRYDKTWHSLSGGGIHPSHWKLLPLTPPTDK